MTDERGNETPDKAAPASPRGEYWTFFWPLTLTGMAMVLARQCQNGALGRFEDATRELAVFAYAWSVFHLFNASVVFIPQMTNALARSHRARRRCLTFTIAISSALTIPVLVLAFTPVGLLLVPRVFPVDERTAGEIVAYLRYLSPLILVTGLRQYVTGLLVQGRRTGLVTILQVGALAVMLGMLIVGLAAGWSAVQTLAIAQMASAAVTLLVSVVFHRRFGRPMQMSAADGVTYGRILAFFWPVALTSVMFALSRPILYAFAGRAAGEATVAAIRVAGDLALIFQNCLNQFRHLFVTFGRTDLPGIRRFLFQVWLAITLAMAAVAFTPLSTLIFRDLLGVEPHVLPMARQVLAVMCLAPLAISVRNYFHGLAMTGHNTVSMGAGGVFRVAALAIGSMLLHRWGWLNHVAAAGLLVGGFAVETIVVILTRLIQRDRYDPGLDAATVDQEDA